MNKKKMCFLMATVVTVNTFGGGVLPTLTAYASEVSVEKNYEAQAVNIAKAAELKIVRKETMQLKVSDKLVGAITWTSSNPHIATVNEQGHVAAAEKGFSIITATDSKGNKETWKLDVMYMDNIPTVPDEFYAELREKWLGTIIGVNNDLSSPNVQRVINRIDGFVEQHWTSIKTDGGILWDAKNVANYETDPAHTRTMYLNLEWMAKGYATPESKYYQNEDLLKDIKYGLEWLYENGYGIQEQYGNWWQWEIGIPKALNNICVMLFDELGEELIDKYTDVIYFHQPDPFHSGASGVSPNAYRESEAANRVDVSMVSLVMGMLRNDYEQLAMTRDAIGSLLKYEERTEDGKYLDGFYEDGSFIQHGHVPYVGTYGNVFLTGASSIVKVLEGSTWEVPKDKLDILTSFGMDSFAPFIYKGAAMDMVRGRAVARDNETDRKSGHSIMGSFLLLSEVVSEDLAEELKTYAKNWILEDTSTSFLEGTNNIELINLAEGILKDTRIKSDQSKPMHKNFELMDRAVHKGKDYALGLSMFSNRISNFEYMNGENVRGWHTADGMTYLYNNDLAHYSDNYWNTVNPYRMPGTTVDTVKLDREELANNGENGQKLFSKEDWVGGTQLGAYGVNGMALSGDLVTDKGVSSPASMYKSLEAKKSYFMFDDEVVLLGTGISSTEGREIETIIENRKIKDDAANKVTVDGKVVASELGKEETVSANWAHLEGNVDGSDIGYYFPSKQKVNVKKVSNTGSWADVKKGGKTDEVTKNYVEMWFSHGVNPSDATYEYVLLPGKSAKDTEKYAKKSEVEILANTEKIQAVKESNLGVLAANFWVDEVATIGDITVNKKASIMTKNDKKTLEVAIADPTMKNEEVIEVEIKESAKSVVSQDKGITITQLSPTIKFTVDVKAAEGKTFNVKFNLKK